MERKWLCISREIEALSRS